MSKPNKTQRLLRALDKSIDWLKRNPDKHIGGKLARTYGGHSVSPMDTRAYCFCALGRVAHEMGIDEPNLLEVVEGLSKGTQVRQKDVDNVWWKNDAGIRVGNREPGILALKEWRDKLSQQGEVA